MSDINVSIGDSTEGTPIFYPNQDHNEIDYDGIDPVETTEDTTEESTPTEEPQVTTDTAKTRPTMVLNPNMYIYFDCEMTKLSMDGKLLSIGLVDAQDHTFYAEFSDYDFSEISGWVFENVLKNMTKPIRKLNGDHWTSCGTKEQIGKDLLTWIYAVRQHTGCPGVQFVSDCCHYDMVFLIDLLWGNALDIPAWCCPFCVDINEEMGMLIAGVVHKDDIVSTNVHIGPMYNPYKQAFDMNRDEQVQEVPNPPAGQKHNALYDARVIRALHQHIQQINVNPSPLNSVAR